MHNISLPSRCRLLAGLLVAASLSAGSLRAEEEGFFLRGGETVLFFGDSITQNGGYVDYVEAFLRTRFPDVKFQVINHGISSETVSGTSEEDHDPRRPDSHARFARDVAEWRPDVLVACFGMNDGNYHPFGQERFEKYQAGVRRLLARAADEAGSPRVTLLTPPPYDPYYRKAFDPAAKTFGYKFAAIDYDETLRRYSQWLVTLRDEHLPVVDLHTAMNDHMCRRREESVSFTLSPDAVHPDPTGHLLMALLLLETWRAPADVAIAEIDAGETVSRDAVAEREKAGDPRVVRGDISDLAKADDGLRFVWRAKLPWPADPRWDVDSVALAEVASRLNRQVLVVKQGAAAKYRLLAGDAELAVVTREQLAQGVNLAEMPMSPAVLRSQQVLKLVQERNRMVYDAWRKRIANQEGTAELGKTDRRAAALNDELRKLCQPMEIALWLVP